jgi:hypothetical protein
MLDLLSACGTNHRFESRRKLIKTDVKRQTVMGVTRPKIRPAIGTVVFGVKVMTYNRLTGGIGNSGKSQGTLRPLSGNLHGLRSSLPITTAADSLATVAEIVSLWDFSGSVPGYHDPLTTSRSRSTSRVSSRVDADVRQQAAAAIKLTAVSPDPETHPDPS